TVRTARPCSSASRRATAPTSDADLPPNAPPFASGVAGSPPGSHHDASGSRYTGSTHDVARRTPPAGHGGSSSGGRLGAVVRRPWTLAARARASVSDGPSTHRAPAASSLSVAASGGRGTATADPAGAVSSAKPPAPSGTSGATRWSTPPSRAARRPAAPRSRRGSAGPAG